MPVLGAPVASGSEGSLGETNLNVSRDKDIAYMKELERTDPQRFHRLQRNILKDYPRGAREIQQREKLEKPAEAA